MTPNVAISNHKNTNVVDKNVKTLLMDKYVTLIQKFDIIAHNRNISTMKILHITVHTIQPDDRRTDR